MRAARQLLPDRAGLGLGRRVAAHHRAARTATHYVLERQQGLHLRRRRHRPLSSSWCRTGGDGPSGHLGLLVEKGTPGLAFGSPGEEAGLERPADRAWSASTTAACRSPTASARRARASRSPCAASTAAGSTSPPARWAARGLPRAGATAYLQERRQFGQPLADFQALQFRLADMATELDAARLMVRRAAASSTPARSRGHAVLRHGQAVRHRRRLRGRQPGAAAARRLRLPPGLSASSAILRDLRVHQILEGTNEIMRVIIARRLAGAA